MGEKLSQAGTGCPDFSLGGKESLRTAGRVQIVSTYYLLFGITYS
jgi:hypothetical protein